MLKNIGGYATITLDGKVRECDTFSCIHCNRIVHVPVGRKIEEFGDFCRNCMKLTCNKPECVNFCFPFYKKLEIWDSQDPAHAIPFDKLFK